MKFPKMKCEQCGECCGIIMCSREEFYVIEKYIEKNNIVPARQGASCPFLVEDKSCAIYQFRPYLCKLFGHTHTLRCCHGHNVNVSLGQVERLSEQHMPKVRAACLHEFCYSNEEIAKIIDDMTNKALNQ